MKRFPLPEIVDDYVKLIRKVRDPKIGGTARARAQRKALATFAVMTPAAQWCAHGILDGRTPTAEDAAKIAAYSRFLGKTV